MSNSEKWYIVKTQDSHCNIVNLEPEKGSDPANIWGPFVSREEAIARRVGLIRAGKCQPL